MKRRYPSLIGPLILITLGVLFLLSNLGALPFTFWEVAARYWPLILILVGLEIIIGRHSIIGGLVVIVLWLGIVGGIVWLSLSQGALPVSGGTNETINQALSGIASATVDLNVGVAQVNLSALNSDSNDLMVGNFSHGENIRVNKTFSVSGTEGRLGLGENGVNPFWGANSSRWDLKLNPDIPMTLHINGGIGRAMLDLAALKISAMTIDAGVGNLIMTTPKNTSTTMSINGGLGNITINIPSGVAARIRVNNGLGNTNVDQTRFAKSDKVYQSANFANAEIKIDIAVDGGLGNLTIQ